MAAVLLLIQLCFTTSIALAKEKVTIAIISFSPYAPWYIVQEKGLAKDIEIDVQIIDDINAKNAGLTTGTLQCMLNTLDTVVCATTSTPSSDDRSQTTAFGDSVVKIRAASD